MPGVRSVCLRQFPAYRGPESGLKRNLSLDTILSIYIQTSIYSTQYGSPIMVTEIEFLDSSPERIWESCAPGSQQVAIGRPLGYLMFSLIGLGFRAGAFIWDPIYEHVSGANPVFRLSMPTPGVKRFRG